MTPRCVSSEAHGSYHDVPRATKYMYFEVLRSHAGIFFLCGFVDYSITKFNTPEVLLITRILRTKFNTPE